MDEYLLDRTVHFTKSNPNFSRILNRDLQPVLQYACVWSPNASGLNLFISGIPYALDTYRQFTTSVYAVFSRNDRGLLAPSGDTEEIITFILSQNHTLQHYLRQ
jgi:hypothetical protein